MVQWLPGQVRSKHREVDSSPGERGGGAVTEEPRGKVDGDLLLERTGDECRSKALRTMLATVWSRPSLPLR